MKFLPRSRRKVSRATAARIYPRPSMRKCFTARSIASAVPNRRTPPGRRWPCCRGTPLGNLSPRHLPGVPRDTRNFRDFFLTGESAFFSALAVALALTIFLQLGIATNVALASAGILSLATPIAVYSGWLFSEPLATALLLAAAASFLPCRPARRSALRRALAAGAFLGAAMWVRPTHVIVVPLFFFAIFVRDRDEGWRAAVGLAAIAGVCAALSAVEERISSRQRI